MIQPIIYGIDRLSRAVGHTFAWSVVILIAGTSYEVFMRYALNDPTSWAFDFSYICYGGLFFMAGAYTLSRGAHVRCDVFYRLLSVRHQAAVDLLPYVLFFSPGVLALTSSGRADGVESMRILESSVRSPAGVPIWPMKMLVPFGTRCSRCRGIAPPKVALMLFVGYFLPLVIKLKDVLRSIVLLAGIALVCIEFWESLRD